MFSCSYGLRLLLQSTAPPRIYSAPPIVYLAPPLVYFAPPIVYFGIFLLSFTCKLGIF